MYAMELNGTHITHKLRVSWRFKSWKADMPDAMRFGYLAKIKHEPGGEVWLSMVDTADRVPMGRTAPAFRVPFDATVEVIE